MWKYLDLNNLISKHQFGFRAGHSTSDASTYVFQHLTNSINNREEACIVFLDISRAFDHVWYPDLLAKFVAANCKTASISNHKDTEGNPPPS